LYTNCQTELGAAAVPLDQLRILATLQILVLG
jgi:hypothetical protein